MPRIDLAVPFAQKDEAKGLGARWDGTNRVWYLPDGTNPDPFKKWMPDDQAITIRSTSYFICQSSKPCWRCGEVTQVYGFVLPAGYETLEADDDDEEAQDHTSWVKHEDPTILSYVSDLTSSVASRIMGLSPKFRLDFSKTTESSYWMNHCERCGMKQGDFEMFSEPGGAFYPCDSEEAERITLHHVAEPFGGSGDVSYGDLFIENMRIA